MSIIHCNDCGNKMSDDAIACPQCGKPNKNAENKRSVGILLGIGIVFMPLIFAWFTLRKGHSTKAKVASFIWMAMMIISVAQKSSTHPHKKVGEYPKNTTSYYSMNNEIGCESKYSDDKKSDVFKSKYKNNWMTWKGKVALAESDEVSLNIDGFGTQDLRVSFADKKAGYDLTIGELITVKFLMKSAGGCFLPFTGDSAVIIK